MPKILPTAPKEGDVITKESLLDLKNNIEAVDLILDDENFREEGLDWRVFNDSGTVEPISRHRGPVTTSTNKTLEHSVYWKVPVWPSGSISGGFSSTTPRIDFQWDPETDTDIIIRCSLFADSNAAGKSMQTHVMRDYEAWEFGLYIIPPGDSLTEPERPKVTAPEYSGSGPPGVWPYQRMHLCHAFSELRRRGHKTYGEHYGSGGLDGLKYLPDGTAGDVARSQAIYSGSLLQAWPTSAHYPAGQWDQYGFDRSSRMNQSFTLVSHATSDREKQQFNVNTRFFTTAGTGRAYLVYRSRFGADGKSSTPVFWSESHPRGQDVPGFRASDSGIIGIDSLNMSYQIIRR